MRIKNVLVTGGAGYVGAVLVPQLIKKGYEVKVLDWFLYGEDVFEIYKDNRKLIQIKGDLRDKKTVMKALVGTEAVIHLACISNDPSFDLDPSLGKSVNYESTLFLADESKRAGVKRFIYASSSSVYGIKKEAKVSEVLKLEPLTDYSKYKAICEKYILEKAAHHGNAYQRWPARIRIVPAHHEKRAGDIAGAGGGELLFGAPKIPPSESPLSSLVADSSLQRGQEFYRFAG